MQIQISRNSPGVSRCSGLRADQRSCSNSQMAIARARRARMCERATQVSLFIRYILDKKTAVL